MNMYVYYKKKRTYRAGCALFVSNFYIDDSGILIICRIQLQFQKRLQRHKHCLFESTAYNILI
jgi:hypothetical protein